MASIVEVTVTSLPVSLTRPAQPLERVPTTEPGAASVLEMATSTPEVMGASPAVARVVAIRSEMSRHPGKRVNVAMNSDK